MRRRAVRRLDQTHRIHLASFVVLLCFAAAMAWTTSSKQPGRWMVIPLLGWLVLLYWAVQPSEGDNDFGPAP